MHKSILALLFSCILLLACQELPAQNSSDKKLTILSRSSGVKIASKGTSLGSGFFIKDDLVVTCFHVIANIQISEGKINYQIYDDLVAIDEAGNSFPLECISMPTDQSPEPFINDFAVLKLKINNRRGPNLKLSEGKVEVSDKVLFSGYPFGLPTMITHSGEVSGIVKDSLIYVQAPINNGSSGSALLNNKGEVVGIVTFKLGGVGQALEEQLKNIIQIQQSFGKASIQFGVIESNDGSSIGFDQIEFAKETISTLHKFLETGIGGVRQIRYLKEYLKKKNL